MSDREEPETNKPQRRRPPGALPWIAAVSIAILNAACIQPVPPDEEEDVAEQGSAIAAPAGPSGAGWSYEAASAAGAPSTAVADSEVIVIRSLDGVADAPIAESIRQSMYDDLTATPGEGGVYLVSPSVNDAVLLEEAGGDATGALQAVSETAAATKGLPGGTTAGIGCSDTNGVLSVPVSVTEGKTAVLGTSLITSNVTLSGTIQAAYRVRRAGISPVCVSHWVKLRHVRAEGTVQAQVGGNISLTNSITAAWGTEVAKPPLGGVSFWAGPIPVVVGFNMPISLGLAVETTAAASLTFSSTASVSGTFDYTCKLNGACSGTRSLLAAGASPAGITGQVSGRATVKVWTDLALRAFLLHESIAYAQIGVQPMVWADLWGYSGNGCGDANEDGTQEAVSAVTLDVDRQVALTSRISIFDQTVVPNGYLWHGPRDHVTFKVLAGGSALTPLLAGPANPTSGQSATYNAKMRPCWPYTDKVTGSLSWGDGTTTSLQMPASAAHTWSAEGARTLGITAISDAHGRSLGSQKTSRTVQVLGSSGGAGDDDDGGIYGGGGGDCGGVPCAK